MRTKFEHLRGAPQMSGVYAIVNRVTGKIYVGSAVHLAGRWRMHVSDLGRNIHGNKYLQSSWNKYGSSAFVFEAVVYCNPEHLIFWEQIAIDGHIAAIGWDNMYNLSPTAGSPLGYKQSAEAKAKRLQSRMGKTYPRTQAQADATLKAQAATRGKKHTEETKKKMSRAAAGRDMSKIRWKTKADWKPKPCV